MDFYVNKKIKGAILVKDDVTYHFRLGFFNKSRSIGNS